MMKGQRYVGSKKDGHVVPAEQARLRTTILLALAAGEEGRLLCPGNARDAFLLFLALLFPLILYAGENLCETQFDPPVET